MAEFKFSCPQCDQHIQCDTGYAGAQINCPTCNQLIVVPQPPRSAAAPPAPPATPPSLSIPARQNTPAPAAFRKSVAPVGQPAVQQKSHLLRNILIITSAVVVLAALGCGGWIFYSKHKAKVAAEIAAKGNPSAQVAAPSADSTMQALGILSKVHTAYTNITSVSADGTFTMSLDVSNITMSDVNPKTPPDSKNAKRHPPGMPRLFTITAEISMKRTQPDWYYVAGDAVSKIDRQTISNTFAFWKSDKGQFMFNDTHQKMLPPSYRQLAAASTTNSAPDQFKNFQHLFDDPANLAKIIKDLGQTDDESVNGQDCYTLTAKVMGQKVKVWVDKTSYLISQWQITLGGAIGDADIDDAFSLFATGFTNVPAMQLNMIKTQVKTFAPVMAKIRGTITSTSKDIQINPTLTADDFNYPVPEGVRLIPFNAIAARGASPADRETVQRNICINNLRQIDAAKNQFALEKGKKDGDTVVETDITPYLVGGKMPTCPSGGTYTIGNIGEKPTCSTAGHFLP